MTEHVLEASPVLRVAGRNSRDEVLNVATSAASLPVVAVGSTGLSALEPLVLATQNRQTAFYESCTPQRAADLADTLDNGELDIEDADAVIEHASTPTRLPIPDRSPLGVGTRTVLGRCGWLRPTCPNDYRASGGFETLTADGETVVGAARRVTGRGWGDAMADTSVGDSWKRVIDADGDPAVVVNAHGTPSDRLLLESLPFLPLEGALAAAQIVDASDVIIYLSEADNQAHERVTAAIENLPQTNAAVHAVTGPDEYRAAEPTMALEAIEGSQRLEARLRPPQPDIEGIYGRPTLVHTPRTLAQIVHATSGAAPTRIVTIRGDVQHEATVELPADGSLATAREAVTVDGTFKCACVGGQFGGLTPDLDIAPTPDALGAAGVGTEGVIDVLNEDQCLVAYIGEQSRFAQDENCGRCVPCREGTVQLTDLLREVYDGSFRPDAIEELLRVIESSSICAFGRDATRPVATGLDHFEDEFAVHAGGQCPTGTCTTELQHEVSQ
ncbi:NADH-ubiquinone oxidoreductase-F iron-sulfur binding region domain-containing protein [Halocatena salina]|uniref:NADH dehydrogenase FAD-containing subunit n=1 Tax=Halocatena salina TaxID=2934340 RepID=A0A8U0A7D0_9EURY|nr:NADH-ubiquinone oxidoreductase-F iron-sulfur binding region domain-containing protein [Halocatena salina]UPM44914.1 NADH dehydrogenase FAD-containing subunit [Halocatena salina]